MTVPPHFRRGSDPPAILILHKALLSPDEILHEHGYAVTIPLRAILDVAQSGDASRDLIQQALTEGKARGLITRRQVYATLQKPNLDPWLRKALQAA